MKNLPLSRTFPIFVCCAWSGIACGQERMQLADLADLSLEQLANVTVTSASRRPERVLDAPASIFVLTAEDIRRSGATTLPEALRLAPNLQVVRGDTSQYVISARGGLSGTANKMLVLMDGRTVYTPLFAGVFWDAQNVMIEDIDRIEVISGPGSTLWGTNAVNGVINITTRSAGRTQGGLVAVGGGDQEKGLSLRMGGTLADEGHYRVYAKYFERAGHQLASGASARDEAERWQTGFRSDWERSGSTVTVQGDLYKANVDNLGGVRPLSGANVLGRWRARPGSTAEFFVQAYFDRTEREHAGSFKEERDTFDVEFQQSLRPRGGPALTWGGGYRVSRDRTEATPVLTFMPLERTLNLANVFVQGEAQVHRNVRATAGLRAERNPYTGVEWLPNLRLQMTLSPDQLLWTAATRAVRSPSRIDRDLQIPGMPPFVVVANDSYQSEIAKVVELGYRAQLRPGVTVSLTAFHHDFTRLRTVGAFPAGLQFANDAEGRNNGLEGWADVTVTRDWRLVGGFVLMREKFNVVEGRTDLGAPSLGNDPKRTATLRSLWNVTRAHEIDLAWHYVGALPSPEVPAYSILNARFGWRPARDLELSLSVNNALDRKHSEFGSAAERAVLGRNVYFKVTWAP